MRSLGVLFVALLMVISNSNDAVAGCKNFRSVESAAKKAGWKLSVFEPRLKANIVYHYHLNHPTKKDIWPSSIWLAEHDDWTNIRIVLVGKTCVLDAAEMGPNQLYKLLADPVVK